MLGQTYLERLHFLLICFVLERLTVNRKGMVPMSGPSQLPVMRLSHDNIRHG